MSKIPGISEAVINGSVKLIEGLVQEALDSGVDPNAILNDGMIAAMGVMGERFQNNEVFVPELMQAAKTMKKGTALLRPFLAGDGAAKHGKCVIGTVKGDMHDIGKNLVALMIESAGFEIVDLGVDVPPQMFVEALGKNPDCKLVAASALLTTTMGAMQDTVKAIRASEHGSHVKIIVGGAPVTQEYADEIGADAYAPDAGSAATRAKELVSLKVTIQ
jgi:corrinoid protein of di/trimethylamine methyltransferase